MTPPDLAGQPTKVDPRDFPDPLQVDPDGEPQRGDPPRPARGDWGCSVFAVALLLALLVAGCQYALQSPPKPDAPVEGSGLVGSPMTAGPVGLRLLRTLPGPQKALPRKQKAGAPLTPEVLAGGTTYSGKLAWADPKYGSRYLALREPRGTLVELCAASGCVQRRSTDFGPVLSLWRAGRIADVSAADFLEICGVPLSFGLCPGSVQVLERPRIELPATDLEGP